jgi:hypothetical protein
MGRLMAKYLGGGASIAAGSLSSYSSVNEAFSLGKIEGSSYESGKSSSSSMLQRIKKQNLHILK